MGKRVRSGEAKNGTEQNREDDVKTDVKNLSAPPSVPPLSFHKFAPGAQRTREERGARDDGMTNGIWHAMHTADKGEGNGATVCLIHIWGNLQDDVKLFFEGIVRFRHDCLHLVSNHMQPKCFSRAPCNFTMIL